MANQQLTTYIKAQLDKGVVKDAIATALLGAGWMQSEIDAAFTEVSGAAAPAVAAQGAVSQPSTMTQTVSTQPVTATEAATTYAAAQPATSTVTQSASATNPFLSQTNRTSSLDSSSVFAQPDAEAAMPSHTSRYVLIGIVVAAVIVIAGGLYWYLTGANSIEAPAADQTQDIQRLTQENEQLKAQVSGFTAAVS